MRYLFLLISFLPFPYFGNYVQAQPATQGADAGSTGSYWRVLTDAGSRNTRVQFFGHNHMLLYEESVPEKWIRHSKRNQRRLDKLLAEISASKLIVSRLKTEELSAAPPRPAPVPAAEIREGNTGGSSYQIHVTANSEGKIRLVVNNPESLRYKIEIVNYRDEIVYQEFTTHAQYRRYLDVSPVIGDNIRVIMSIDGKRLVYNIRRAERRSAYIVDPVIASR